VQAYDAPMGKLPGRAKQYRRKSFLVDAKAIDQARKALGAGTNAEAVRLAVDRVLEMERFWRLMADTRGALKPGSIEAP
jgi:hypothetical protein